MILELDLKKALVLSLLVHIIFLGISSTVSIPRRPIVYWMTTPVELVSVPQEKAKPETTTVSQPPVVKKEIVTKPKKSVPPPKKEVKKKIKEQVVVKAEPKKTEQPAPAPEPVKEEKVVSTPATPAASTVITPEQKDFPFLYYLNIIQNKVSKNWVLTQTAENNIEQKVIIYFKITKNGKVTDVSIEKSSGISFLDQSAFRAVLLSEPFPPLPYEYDGDYLGVHFGFQYKGGG